VPGIAAGGERMQLQRPEVSGQAGDLTGVRRCRRPLRRAALWLASFPAAASGSAFAAWGFSGASGVVW
jgi:hypothetical protein